MYVKKSIKMQSHTGLHGSRAILSVSHLLSQATGKLALHCYTAKPVQRGWTLAFTDGLLK